MTELTMTDFFEDCNKKPALSGNELSVIEDNPRTDLLLEQYKLTRQRLATPARLDLIDSMYMRWCDLLILGYNVVVYGPQSKFALLETFKRRYLESGRLPDWMAAAQVMGENIEPIEKKAKKKSSKKKNGSNGGDNGRTEVQAGGGDDGGMLPMLDITTVRLHGLDPIKAETFNHAIFGIKETRRLRESDFQDFKSRISRENMHHVFLIHSFDRFLESCEEICETIFALHRANPRYIHLLMSTDSWNAGKKTMNLKYSLNLIFNAAPLAESYFWEKTSVLDSQLDAAAATNDTTIHRLFSDKVDLQSLKDIHLAIDSATQYILVFIMRDFVEKCEANEAAEAAGTERKRFQARDAQDDEEQELGPQDTTRAEDEAPVRRRLTRNRAAGSSAPPKTAAPRKRGAKSGAGKRAAATVETSLEFEHLLRHCESKFILRRSTALRDHLGELKDHQIVSEDDSGHIQCLVDVATCRRFIEWIDSTQATAE